MAAGQVNIVRIAIDIIAGLQNGSVNRAAAIIGVSSPTLYRWIRKGDLRHARGAELLRVYELSRIPLELLLGIDAGPAKTRSITKLG